MVASHWGPRQTKSRIISEIVEKSLSKWHFHAKVSWLGQMTTYVRDDVADLTQTCPGAVRVCPGQRKLPLSESKSWTMTKAWLRLVHVKVADMPSQPLVDGDFWPRLIRNTWNVSPTCSSPAPVMSQSTIYVIFLSQTKTHLSWYNWNVPGQFKYWQLKCYCNELEHNKHCVYWWGFRYISQGLHASYSSYSSSSYSFSSSSSSS